MLRTPVASFVALSISLAVAGCSLPASGPTCGEFLNMTNEDKRQAVIDWAKGHDDRVDPDDPDSVTSGFAMFQNLASFTRYCGQPGHEDDHLGDLSPA